MVASREDGGKSPVIGNPGGSIAEVLRPAPGVRTVVDAAARAAGRWSDEVARRARDMPLQALGLALAVGLVLGLAIGAAAGRSRD